MVDTDKLVESLIEKKKEYCTYGKCDNCVFHSNGRCFTQPEVEDNYYNEGPEPLYPIDWEV